MARLDYLLKLVKDNKASDLHLVAGIEPRMRLHGSLEIIDGTGPLEHVDLHAMMRELVNPVQFESYERDLELDFAYGLGGVGRFRANFFKQASGAAAVFRLIPEHIMSCKELSLPAAVERFGDLRSGLVLVTGPTGSGKSTTLAAIIDSINEKYDKHVITIEDPIEFVHQSKMSIFSQREVGTHTKTFASALRSAMRENPDVILVGELRGLEEVELAILAAEMGALVFGTLHTNSAAKTVDRLVDIFPAERHEQIRIGLAEALAGVVSQILLPTADGRARVAVLEVLSRTSGLPNIIREGNTPQLLTLIQSGKQHGMQTMDEALETLLRQGKIRARDAYQAAADKAHFEKVLAAAGETA